MTFPFMRISSLFWAAGFLALSLGSGCRKRPPETILPPPEPETVFRYHFVGLDRLTNDPQAPKLREIGSLPSAAPFRGEVAGKLAAIFSHLLAAPAAGSNGPAAGVLRAISEDLLRGESAAIMAFPAPAAHHFALALQADAAAAARSETNFFQLAAALGWPAPQPLAGGGGWDIPAAGGRKTGSICFLKTNDWVAFAIGDGAASAARGLFRDLKKAGATSGSAPWIEGDLDFERLSSSLGLTGTNWPAARVKIYGKADNVRTEVRLRYPASPRWEIEPWLIPTNTVRDPLISFTAMQGLRTRLAELPLVRQLQTAPPNQAFTWAFAQIPFQTYTAIPAKDPANLLDRIAAQFPTLLSTNVKSVARGQLRRSPDRAELSWVGLPVLVPFVKLAREPQGAFLLAGAFPPPPSTNPAPAELFRQITGRNNLLYYDWEITSERIRQWTKLAQVGSLILPDLRFSTNSIGQRWIEEMTPHLSRQTAGGLQGDSITELTRVSPREFDLVRRSPVGFTGLELITLRYLLDRPDFPAFLFQLPAAPGAAPVRAK